MKTRSRQSLPKKCYLFFGGGWVLYIYIYIYIYIERERERERYPTLRKKNGLFSGETSLLVVNLGDVEGPDASHTICGNTMNHLNQTNGYPGIKDLQWQYPF